MDLEKLNVVAHRYFQRQDWFIAKEFKQPLTFTGFTPSWDSDTIAAQIIGRSDTGSTGWWYVNVYLSKLDLLLDSWHIEQVMRRSIYAAVDVLNEFVEDPFTRYVRKVREEEGIGELEARG